MSSDLEEPLLAVRDLAVEFAGATGPVRAVDGVSWAVARGQALGVVGESGCGKSVTALSILRLVRPPGRIVGGAIRYRGQDLLSLPEKEMRSLRGDRLAMIFQEPMTALNPVYRAGAQVAEVLRAHPRPGQRLGRGAALDEAPRARFPAPDVGRDAAAGDDRHGARVPARGAHRG
jgi:peptide/nickel transport system ATP-binding protein